MNNRAHAPLILVVCVFLIVLGGCSGLTDGKVSGGGGNPGIQSVNHVVILLQENRSFDSYFGKLNDYLQANNFPQAGQVNGVPAAGFTNVSPTAGPITSYHSGSVCMENMSPDWAEDRHDVNLNNAAGINPANPATMPMDGFVNTAAGLAQPPPVGYDFVDKAGKRAMGFYTDHELNYYYFMAANFGIGDKFYSPVPTNTPNNRIYMFGATSQGTVHTPGGPESCPGEAVQISPKPTTQFPNSGKPIFQVLSEKNITWKIYITDLEPTCDPKNGAFPLDCAVKSTYLQFFTYINSGTPGVINPAVLSHMAPLDCSGSVPPTPAHPSYACPSGVTDYFTDVNNGTLPSVAFIETGGFSGRDEHPSGRDLGSTTPGCFGITGQTCINIEVGAQFVSTIINKLMSSPSWKDTVFFWAMDEGGGAFDHVPPAAVPNPDGIAPILCLGKDTAVGGDFNITGFRVPNIVISPFSKKNFVSHTSMDYTAILKFIETRWSLGNLTMRDAAMPDMTEFFDFAGNPWATPPAPPAQNLNNSPCDFNLQ